MGGTEFRHSERPARHELPCHDHLLCIGSKRNDCEDDQWHFLVITDIWDRAEPVLNRLRRHNPLLDGWAVRNDSRDIERLDMVGADLRHRPEPLLGVVSRHHALRRGWGIRHSARDHQRDVLVIDHERYRKRSPRRLMHRHVGLLRLWRERHDPQNIELRNQLDSRDERYHELHHVGLVSNGRRWLGRDGRRQHPPLRRVRRRLAVASSACGRSR